LILDEFFTSSKFSENIENSLSLIIPGKDVYSRNVTLSSTPYSLAVDLINRSANKFYKYG
jgi:hypothetical protein